MEEFTHKEFKIDTLKEYTFRVAKISPVKLLAISTQVNFENVAMTETLINFSLENTEVKINETWLPVKVAGRDVYQPADIEKNMLALNEIFMYMLTNVVGKVFQQSNA